MPASGKSERTSQTMQGFARWQAADYDRLLDFFLTNAAPDIELYSRFGGFSGEPYRGSDGVRAWLADIQENFERFTPWEAEVRDVLAEKARMGNVAAIRALLAREEQKDPRAQALALFEEMAERRQ
jgi:hypothetical protein